MGSCWSKVGICVVVGVWESIRAMVNRDIVVIVCTEGQCVGIL